MLLVVADHDVQRHAETLEFDQCRPLAHVAEMPDFVGAGEPLRELRRVAVVRVGDDGNAHAAIEANISPLAKADCDRMRF